MSSGKDKFSMFVPNEDREQQMPDQLELIDVPKGGFKNKRMSAGAYDPYQKQDSGANTDTARVRKPRTDLRKLSEWIKTTQRVKVLRAEDLVEAAKRLDPETKQDAGKKSQR